eukprot:8999156-Pyramimonas_sp.AAC.1
MVGSIARLILRRDHVWGRILKDLAKPDRPRFALAWASATSIHPGQIRPASAWGSGRPNGGSSLGDYKGYGYAGE